jgi:hypothetical protein
MYTDFQYSRYQRVNPQGVIAAAVTTSVVAVPAVAKMAVYIQRIVVSITTPATGTIAFRDTVGTVSIFTANGTPSIGDQDVDFGPEGYQLPIGAGLEVIGSAAGPVGVWHVEGYRRIGDGQALSLSAAKNA